MLQPSVIAQMSEDTQTKFKPNYQFRQSDCYRALIISVHKYIDDDMLDKNLGKWA